MEPEPLNQQEEKTKKFSADLLKWIVLIIISLTFFYVLCEVVV